MRLELTEFYIKGHNDLTRFHCKILQSYLSLLFINFNRMQELSFLPAFVVQSPLSFLFLFLLSLLPETFLNAQKIVILMKTFNALSKNRIYLTCCNRISTKFARVFMNQFGIELLCV